MSKRITQILDILQIVSSKYNASLSTKEYSNIRINACKRLTEELKKSNGTISNKFRRELNIKDTAEFDRLCLDWLRNNSSELRDVLLKNSIDRNNDRVRIISFFEDYQNMDLDDSIAPTAQEYKEGKEKYITHKLKERDRKVVKEAKMKWLQQQGGKIECIICQFDFQEQYGDRGLGFIEAHHTVPISTLKSECVVTVEDLVPLCANCHRMIHLKPWISVEELKKQRQIRKKSSKGVQST